MGRPLGSAFFSLVLVAGLWSVGCTTSRDRPVSNMAAAREAKAELADLRAAMKKIEPFYARMGKPARHDWLASHTEAGQTFEEYLDSKPSKPTGQKQKIYLLPLGKFNASEEKMIGAAASFLEAFYDLSVVQMPARQLSVPQSDVRRDRTTGKKQLRSGYILDKVLVPTLPNDAAALLAFTPDDLYLDDSLNYVFGEARLEKRVGVWSLERLDDNTDPQNYLIRTLKIAAHETGHMFSMRHCTKYECLMSGTNNLAETDRRPVDTCPECTAKVCWISDITPAERYRKLIEVCRRTGLAAQAKEFERKLNAVENN